ncbi:MAG TPA: tryptophan synthase subunit alpha [Methanobacteriaceae archaeon]|nr:tryptophan synthase subunit alpha [Methanobacteriaceae archaeon]
MKNHPDHVQTLSKSRQTSSKSRSIETYSEMFKRLDEKGEGAFIPFVVAGDPDFETSLSIVKEMVDCGADALEIGFPFSDPVADGPTIQAADVRALEAGMTVKKGFEFIRKIREFTQIPIGLLVYYNLVYKMGVDQFYAEARNSGVNGILAADLPPEEANYAIEAAKVHGINQIFMAAHTTSNQRLANISQIAGGFIYVVAVMGVTGARSQLDEGTVDLIQRVRKHTPLPICVGFGISQPEHVEKVIKAGSDGAIVASVLIDMVQKHLKDRDMMLKQIRNHCLALKKATREK